MKAIVHRSYGSPDVLRLEEVEKPVPGDDEVLIRVRAAAVNPLDWYFVRGTPRLIRIGSAARKPSGARVGVDVAGEVEATGKDIDDMGPGDPVFGSCRGAFAEYVCTSRSRIVRKPPNVTFEQAASAPVAGVTALQGLRDEGALHPGQTVLINGAAGGVGTFAVQIAKSMGAEVTGVCSTRNLEIVRSIGADAAIDYTREDFTASSKRWDVIFDCMTNHPVSAVRRVLAPEGRYVIAGGIARYELLRPLARVLTARIVSRFVDQTLTTFVAKMNQGDLAALADLLERGAITPVIDTRYALRDAADAVAHVAEGHARGKVVITVG